jgi:hypothetical protein
MRLVVRLVTVLRLGGMVWLIAGRLSCVGVVAAVVGAAVILVVSLVLLLSLS